MKLQHDFETEYSVDKLLIPKYEAGNHTRNYSTSYQKEVYQCFTDYVIFLHCEVPPLTSRIDRISNAESITALRTTPYHPVPSRTTTYHSVHHTTPYYPVLLRTISSRPVPHRTTPYYTVSSRTNQKHPVPLRTTPYNIVSPRTSYQHVPLHTTPYHSVPLCNILYHTVLPRTIPYDLIPPSTTSPQSLYSSKKCK